MVRQSPEEHLKAHIGIPPDAHAAGTVNGGGIDATGFDEALIVANIGVIAATGTSDIKVQDSADNSTFADVTGAAFQQFTDANDQAIFVGRVDVRATRKFIRVVLVQATAAGDIGVTVLLGAAEVVPVTQLNAVEFSV